MRLRDYESQSLLANIVNIRHKLFAVKRQTRGRERDLQVLQLSSLKFPIPEYKINSNELLSTM